MKRSVHDKYRRLNVSTFADLLKMLPQCLKLNGICTGISINASNIHRWRRDSGLQARDGLTLDGDVFQKQTPWALRRPIHHQVDARRQFDGAVGDSHVVAAQADLRHVARRSEHSAAKV